MRRELCASRASAAAPPALQCAHFGTRAQSVPVLPTACLLDCGGSARKCAHPSPRRAQVNKARKWSCAICQQRQTILRPYCQASKAADVRAVVSRLNATHGPAWPAGAGDGVHEPPRVAHESAAGSTAGAAEPPHGAPNEAQRAAPASGDQRGPLWDRFLDSNSEEAEEAPPEECSLASQMRMPGAGVMTTCADSERRGRAPARHDGDGCTSGAAARCARPAQARTGPALVVAQPTAAHRPAKRACVGAAAAPATVRGCAAEGSRAVAVQPGCPAQDGAARGGALHALLPRAEAFTAPFNIAPAWAAQDSGRQQPAARQAGAARTPIVAAAAAVHAAECVATPAIAGVAFVQGVHGTGAALSASATVTGDAAGWGSFLDAGASDAEVCQDAHTCDPGFVTCL